MSRHSLARALLSILVALFLASTATPADAYPRRWGEKYGPLEGAVGRGRAAQDERASLVLRNWTICRNGAKLRIAADESVGPRLELIVESGGERLFGSRNIRLEDKPLRIRYLWFRTRPPTVMRDSPNRPPDEIIPWPGTRFRSSTTVKLPWSFTRARTVRLSMGPAGGDLEPGILRVRKCLLLGQGFQLG
jgi:hypothetical protein